MKWTYGVTTVPERFETTLPRTLASLADAGFTSPRLFVDGGYEHQLGEEFVKLKATCRSPRIRIYGNFILGLFELYIREPNADRYAMFQDDLVTYKNLREYLEQTLFPTKGYWNLYTFPSNESIRTVPGGFYESNQLGRGALALVFDNDGVRKLLASPHMIERPKCAFRGWRNVDGGIITALGQEGYKEYVHYPSLVQHTGMNSTITKDIRARGTENEVDEKGNERKKFVWSEETLSNSFLGEGYDALKLLELRLENPITTSSN